MVRFPAVARFNFLDFPENFKKIVSVCTEKRGNPGCSLAVDYLYIYMIIYIYKYSTASEQPGFLLFRCKRKHYFKILRKIEKIKMRHSRELNHGSPAFRASALTFRLPWHVLIFSILAAPYGLLSAFAFFKQRIFYKYSTASEQPGFLLFRCKRKHYFKILRKIEKIKMRHSRESSHGSPAFRASALTFRLPWHVLIFSILAPYGLLSAFAFFKQRIFYKYSTASEQPGFLLFRCKRKHYFKILRKIEKIKMRHSRESNHGSPAFRASALTFRLPWHVLIFSILAAPYGLLSAFAFFKQRIFYKYSTASEQPGFLLFRCKRKHVYIYIYVLISSISICNKNLYTKMRHRNDPKPFVVPLFPLSAL